MTIIDYKDYSSNQAVGTSAHMFMRAGGTVHPTGRWEEQSEASYS